MHTGIHFGFREGYSSYSWRMDWWTMAHICSWFIFSHIYWAPIWRGIIVEIHAIAFVWIISECWHRFLGFSFSMAHWVNNLFPWNKWLLALRKRVSPSKCLSLLDPYCPSMRWDALEIWGWKFVWQACTSNALGWCSLLLFF